MLSAVLVLAAALIVAVPVGIAWFLDRRHIRITDKEFGAHDTYVSYLLIPTSLLNPKNPGTYRSEIWQEAV